MHRLPVLAAAVVLLSGAPPVGATVPASDIPLPTWKHLSSRTGEIPQIVLAPGDGNGPLLLVECRGDPLEGKSWVGRNLLAREVVAGHTLALADINGDGRLDIFCAEMHTPGNKDQCTAWLLYGDGQGAFQVQQLSVGIGNHDSRIADVDGDGRLDIVTKPYTWDTPRLDIWLNQGSPAAGIRTGAHRKTSPR